MKKRGSFALLDSLVRNGTKHIFGYPGGAILPIYDEVYKWEEKKLNAVGEPYCQTPLRLHAGIKVGNGMTMIQLRECVRM